MEGVIREWLHVIPFTCIGVYTFTFICTHITTQLYIIIHNYTGESIEVLDIGLRKAGGVPVVHRVKPSSPTHRLSVGSPRRHNVIK